MRRALRTAVATVGAAVLLTAAVPTAVAVATAPVADSVPVVDGSGPDDLFSWSAHGFAADTPVTVAVVGVGSVYEAVLGAQVPSGPDATVASSPGDRTPATMTPGTYAVQFTQPVDGGDPVVVISPSFAIEAPAISVLGAAQYVPGAPVSLLLRGLGAGPAVHRTLSVDGSPVPSTAVEGPVDGLRQNFTVPASLAPGVHTVTLTQDVNPTAAPTTTITVSTPSITVTPADSSERGALTVSGQSFGLADTVVVSVTDGGGDQYALATLDIRSSFTTAVQLPGVGGGTATVKVQSRHNRAVATAQVDVYGSQLRSGEYLSAGAKLQSPRAYAGLVMQGDGNLVLYVLGRARWSSRTSGHPGAYLAVQGDGNLVVYSSAGTVLWTAGTARQDPPVRLIVQDDGNLVLYSMYGRALWNTHTAGTPSATLVAGRSLPVGQRLSGNGKVAFVMQSDGNAVLYGVRGTVVWSTRTNGHPGATITLQTDGNLVVYPVSGRAVFANRALVGPGTTLVAQGDGNLVEYASNGKAVWSSGTAGR